MDTFQKIYSDVETTLRTELIWVGESGYKIHLVPVTNKVQLLNDYGLLIEEKPIRYFNAIVYSYIVAIRKLHD